jgi:predicted secreted protein
MRHLTPEQVAQLNERYGYFQYADSQGDVSQAFANDAIEAYERIRLAAPELLEALIMAEAKLCVAEYHLDRGADDSIVFEAEILNARAAIAKARGDL